jgi:hypothetical protein
VHLNAVVRQWYELRNILKPLTGEATGGGCLTMDSVTNAAHATCRHHWVIEMPNGPVSHGQCKVCGMERDFYNNPEDARVGEPQPVASAA